MRYLYSFFCAFECILRPQWDLDCATETLKSGQGYLSLVAQDPFKELDLWASFQNVAPPDPSTGGSATEQPFK